MELKELKGKVALVTGGARGLGRAISVHLAKAGADIVINDVEDARTLGEAVSQLPGNGNHHSWMIADVTKSDEVENMVKQVISQYKHIDILVNNAGGSMDTPARLEEVTDAQWDNVIKLNLTGTFYCCRAMVPYMRQNRYGRIINMASMAGRNGGGIDNPWVSPAYTSAKAGIIAFTKQLAKELGQDNINVNAVAPGLILSGPRVENMYFSRTTEEERNAKIYKIPLRRLGTAEDVAQVVRFLSSGGASYITGLTIDVNGGQFMN